MIRTFAKRLAGDKRGGTALMFAIFLPVLVVLGLGTVDLFRIAVVKQQLQDSLDAAALLAARSAAKTNAETDQVGDQAFADMIIKFDVNSPASTFTVNAEGDLEGKASGELKPLLLGMFSGGKLKTNVDTVVKRGEGSPLELVLVLDTTGSMAGQPLADLKASANSLVDRLFADVSKPGIVKIAVVPFGQYVNVGVSRRNQPWMNVPADYTQTVPFQPSIEHKFHGCAGSPAYPKNVEDKDKHRVYPGFLDLTCGSEITPLTATKSTVTSAISGLTANGWTYIPSGLAWGHNLISKEKPMHEASDYDKSGQNIKPRKVIILMTDGANTRQMNHTTGAHDVPPPGGEAAAEADAYTAQLCTNIKGDKIELFTIAFQLNENNAKKTLSKCATSDLHFYDATDSLKLQSAFDDISLSLKNIYIAK